MPITQIASLFGIFGVVKDRWPGDGIHCVAVLAAGNGLYINIHSSISLNAYDPVVYTTYTGVAFTEFRVEANLFHLCPLFFTFHPRGRVQHFEFRSVDNSENIEVAQATHFM